MNAPVDLVGWVGQGVHISWFILLEEYALEKEGGRLRQ